MDFQGLATQGDRVRIATGLHRNHGQSAHAIKMVRVAPQQVFEKRPGLHQIALRQQARCF